MNKTVVDLADEWDLSDCKSEEEYYEKLGRLIALDYQNTLDNEFHTSYEDDEDYSEGNSLAKQKKLYLERIKNGEATFDLDNPDDPF